MKFHLFVLYFVVLINIWSPVSGRLRFRRLTANDVYKALQEAGRMDAVPEGRVVTQGIAAAATGFIVGAVKGVAIPLLLGLATAANKRAIITPAAPAATQTQEICFSSRSLNEIENDDNEEDDEEESDMPQARQGDTLTSTTTPTTPTSPISPTATSSSPPEISTSPTTPTTGTGTNTETTTTDNKPGGTVNCIVVQKPVRR